MRVVASYTVNGHAMARARGLIDAHQYVLRRRWNDVQPRAADQNAFLKTHSWDDYSAWQCGTTEASSDRPSSLLVVPTSLVKIGTTRWSAAGARS